MQRLSSIGGNQSSDTFIWKIHGKMTRFDVPIHTSSHSAVRLLPTEAERLETERLQRRWGVIEHTYGAATRA